jgi:hypothetical protein
VNAGRHARAQARKAKRLADRLELEARLADAASSPRATKLWRRARKLAAEAERLDAQLGFHAIELPRLV